MLIVDNGDAIRGIAEVATKLDFTVNGYVGTTGTQLADGQIGTGEGDLYLSGANNTKVTSITIVNTDSVARTFTLYLKPSGGTSRAITPVSLDLGVGYSFYTDGQKMLVLTPAGATLATATAHALGGGSHSEDTLSNLNSKISDATLVDTGSIVLKTLFDANTILAATSDDTPAALTVAEQRIVGRITSGNITALTAAQVLTLINVTAGADITGSNAPQAHKDLHDPEDGSDPLDTAGPNALLEVQAQATGTSHSVARADHDHAIVHDITDNSLTTVDGTTNTPVNGDIAKFTALGLEGQDKSQMLSFLNVDDGADVTGSNAPQAHKASHETGGGDEVNDVDINAGTIGGVTIDGVLAMSPSTHLTLPPSPLADGEWCGIVEAHTSGDAQIFGDLCYFKTSDSEMYKAKADVAVTARLKLGICLFENAGNTIGVPYLLYGKVRADAAFPALTIGEPVHIDAGTAGDIVVAAPSGTTNFVVRRVGYGNTADELFFCPDNTTIELA